MHNKNHIRQSNKALTLKKAWLCAVAMLGGGKHLVQEDTIIFNYETWPNKKLKIYISDLQVDFEDIVNKLFINWEKEHFWKIATWFSKRFDAWSDINFMIFELGRVDEIETLIGRLRCHKYIDCPPYAQLLLQGFTNPAIRHPEYHLATDIALLYNLHLDIDNILDDALQKKNFIPLNIANR